MINTPLHSPPPTHRSRTTKSLCGLRIVRHTPHMCRPSFNLSCATCCIHATGIEADVDTLSIVVHTSVGFGHTHVNTDPAEVQSVVLERLQGLYPELPTPAEVKTQRWRYSQVTEAFSVPEGGEMKDVVVGRDSAAVMLLPWGKGGPAVVLAGDGFTTSNLEGCLESATAAVELVRSRL